MKQKEGRTFTTMIHGYGQNGDGYKALELFRKMQSIHTPDTQAITSVLNACSHVGLIDEALDIFNNMQTKYKVKPDSIHLTCIVDLLSRKGELEAAIAEITRHPHLVSISQWMAVLGGARKFNNIAIGELAFGEIQKIDSTNAASFVLMANIYAANKMMDMSKGLRENMSKHGIKKIPGKTFVEIDRQVHEFYVEDNCHPEIEEIYKEMSKLNNELMEAGYTPDTSWVLRDLEEMITPSLISVLINASWLLINGSVNSS